MAVADGAAVRVWSVPLRTRVRGIEVREIRNEREGVFQTLVRVTVATSQGDRSVAGTLFGRMDGGGAPRPQPATRLSPTQSPAPG